MATYKGIQGYTVQKLSSDPTASDIEGQLFYNSATGKFKIGATTTAAWSSGGTMNTGRGQIANSGTGNTSALAFGGYNPSPIAAFDQT